MNPTDLVIIAVILVFVYLGTKKGLIDEILGITGWIIAVICALKFAGVLGRFITAKIPQLQTISTVLAALVILFGIRYSFLLIIKMLKKSSPKISENSYNKVAGAFLGVLQGVLVIGLAVILFLVIPFGPNVKKLVDKSIFFPQMKKVSVFMVNTVANFIPQTRTTMDQVLAKMDEKTSAADGLAPADVQKIQDNVEKQVEKVNDSLPAEIPEKEDAQEMEKKIKKLDEELRR
ncbi:MAG TPA: CvpA family protein [bacterium]|nr:CvpA family protein [bacterium]HPN45265.1 CvpA family protein [bacterium]